MAKTKPLTTVNNVDVLRGELNAIADVIAKYEEPANPDTGGAERVRQMANDLGTSDITHWFDLNVMALVGMDSLERRMVIYSPGAVLTNWLDVIRNILVVVQILATWGALWITSLNYQTAVKTVPDLRFETFLLLGRSSGTTVFSFSLVEIAGFDALVLLIIFVITFFVHWRKDVTEHHAADNALKIRRRLEAALWQVRLLTPSGGQTSTRGLLSQAIQAINELKNIYTIANQSVTDLQTGVAALQAGSAALQASSSNFSLVEQSVKQASLSLGQTATTLPPLVKSLSTTATSIASSLQSFQAQLPVIQQISQAITDSAQKQHEATQALLQASHQLQSIQPGFDKYFDALVQAMKALRSSASKQADLTSPLQFIAAIQIIQVVVIIVVSWLLLRS